MPGGPASTHRHGGIFGPRPLLSEPRLLHKMGMDPYASPLMGGFKKIFGAEIPVLGMLRQRGFTGRSYLKITFQKKIIS